MTRWFLSLLLFCSSLQSMENITPDISLRPEEPEPPALLGFHFGQEGKKTLRLLIAEGLTLEEQKRLDEKTVAITLKGVPQTWTPLQGSTKLILREGRLIQATIYPTASYKNFLIARQRMHQQLPAPRYHITAQQEVLEPQLRSYLAGKDIFDEEAEEAAVASLIKGRTFYLYRIDDAQTEARGSLLFHATSTDSGNRTPSLSLSFTLPVHSFEDHQ